MNGSEEKWNKPALQWFVEYDLLKRFKRQARGARSLGKFPKYHNKKNQKNKFLPRKRFSKSKNRSFK